MSGRQRLTHRVLGHRAGSAVFQVGVFIQQNKTTGWSNGFLEHKSTRKYIEKKSNYIKLKSRLAQVMFKTLRAPKLFSREGQKENVGCGPNAII